MSETSRPGAPPMSPLPLSGQASEALGFAGHNTKRILIRVRDPHRQGPNSRSDAALVRNQADLAAGLRRGYTTSVVIGDTPCVADSRRVIRLKASFGYLADGDVLGVDLETRRLRTLYRRRSEHNSFLVTERCDNYCLMCSQPPRDVDDNWILDEIEEALPLVDRATTSVGFTGGEPLLQWSRLTQLLSRTAEILPDTDIHVLTNGRAFARRDVTMAWAGIRHPRLCAGIPVYSSVDVVHDHIVQAQGAFEETLMGILRLKDAGQRVEVRIVLHALTTPGLLRTCAWFARNLPFVDHFALMGLEHTGFALANAETLWIDPVDYANDLADGVRLLTSAGLNVSVYNLPRCLLPPEVWPYAVQSISDWKNAFLPACDACSERPKCGGFFSTGKPRFSRGIYPL